MKKIKKATVAMLAVSLSVSNIALAAPSDVHFKDGGLFKTATEMGLSQTLKAEVGVNPGKYVYEGKEGKLYNLSVVNNTFKEQGGNFDKMLEQLKEKESVGQVGEVVEELKVTEISAINKTTLKVVLSDETTHEVTLETALEADVATEVTFKIDEKEYTATVTFVVPGAEELWNLDITVKNAKGEEVNSLPGDGVSTAVVSFELKDKLTGEVDEKANDIVLFVSATRGKLAQERVTIQNGKADMIIQSEFFADKVEAKIDAQIIEASPGYTDLIGKVVASKTIQIVPVGEGQEPITVVSLVNANSNEADRVTLTFDGAVKPSDFYDVETGVIKPNRVKITQKADKKDIKEIKGFLFDKNNNKKVIVVLGKANVLVDNTDVRVSAKIGDRATEKSANFKLTDARKPSVTAIESDGSNNQLEVRFSEPIHKANFIIDGRFDGTTFGVEYGEIVYNIKEQRFVDNRNIANIKLNPKYQETEKKDNKYVYPKGYFKPGKHSLESSDIYDFAAISDISNIGTTQVLEFKVGEVEGVAEIVREVHSPEQFLIKFDKQVAFVDGKGKESSFEKEFKFEVLNAKGDWVVVNKAYFTDAVDTVDFDKLLKVTQLKDSNDYKVELTQDWTNVYNTKKTRNNYYNDEFRVRLPKGALVTAANGKINDEDMMVLLSNDTALSMPDTVSPKIEEMKLIEGSEGRFIVTMTEPVKLEGKLDTSKEETLAQNQDKLPTTLVEFLGKDKDEKIRTFLGEVVGYYTLNKNDDTEIEVQWNKDPNNETPQTVVNDGGSGMWTLVVKAISDDVGNTTPTATAIFTLTTDTTVVPIGDFMVNPSGGSAIGDDGETSTYGVKGEKAKETEKFDKVIVDFTQEITTSGLGSAVNVNNYTLNGRRLPTGSSIRISDIDAKQITITLPKGTLEDSNVLVIAQHLVSAEGKTLTGDVTFTFEVKKAEEDAKTLEDAKKVAEAKVEAQYTAESFAKLTAALALPETTEAEKDAKLAAINTAVKELEKVDEEEEKLDKVALDAAKVTAATKVEAEYTPESFAKLTEALALAETTQDEINAKVEAINKALGELAKVEEDEEEEKLDKVELEAAKATAATKVEAEYTPESYADLTAALALEETTQEEIDAKVAAINLAVSELAKVEEEEEEEELNKVELEAAKATAATKVEAEYTPESYADLTAALALEETTQEEIDVKVAAINLAVSELAKVEEEEELNKVELEAAKATAATKVEAEYTPESYADLTAALALEETTQEEIDVKVAAINLAVSELAKVEEEEELNKVELEAAKATAATKVEAEYTPESYADLTAALALEETTQEEIDAKVAAINLAVSELATK